MTKGFQNAAQRITNAEERFLGYAMETAGLTRAEALTALATMRRAKAIKIDAVGGAFTFTHGAYADAAVLRRAAGLAEAEPVACRHCGETRNVRADDRICFRCMMQGR